MRQITKLVPIVILAIIFINISVPIVNATAGSLVSNGTFTSDLSSWSSSGTITASWASDGTAEIYVTGSSATGEGYIYQSFNNSYVNLVSATLTFKYGKSYSGSTAIKQDMYIRLVSSGGTVTTLWSENTITETKSMSSLQTVNILSYLSSSGTYTLRLGADLQCGSDASSRTSVFFDDVQITVDGTVNNAPSVQVTSPNGGETWYGTTENLQWRGADIDGNTVTYSIYVSTDSGTNYTLVTTASYTESATVENHSISFDTTTYSDSTNAYIKITANDGVTSVSDTSDAKFTIANTLSAPTLVSPVNTSTIANTTPTLTWENVFAPAGLQYYTVSIASDISFSSVVYTTNVVENRAVVSTALSDGTYYWRVKTTDQAGTVSNWSSTFSFSVFTYAPTITAFTINTGASYATSRTVTAAVTAEYAYYISYSFDGTVWTDWESYTSARSKSLELPSGDGAKIVYTKVKDSLGHTSSISTYNIILDTTPPITAFEVSGDLGEDGKYKNSAVVHLRPSDATSGVDFVYYKLDNGDWQIGPAGLEATVPVYGEGSHTLYYYTMDLAGNKDAISEATIKVYTPSVPLPWALIMGLIAVGVVVGIVTWKKVVPAVKSWRNVRRIRKRWLGGQYTPEGIPLEKTKLVEKKKKR